MGSEPTEKDESWGDWASPELPAQTQLSQGISGRTLSEPAILRRLITCRKTPQGKGPTAWSQDPIPPRFSPYPKPRPPGRLTEWRAIRASAAELTFIVLCLVQPAREDFRAWLVIENDAGGRSVLVRWEHHGAHAPDGIHSHSWCAEPQPPVGPASIDAPRRLPGPQSYHRRSGIIWSKETFWIDSCRRYGIALAELRQGQLAL